MEKKSSMKNLHSGHRNRMLKRFLSNHTEGFSQHEILEMILFQVIPRANTNETAHLLIEQFGSVRKLFLEGKISDFMQISGIGLKSAAHLAVIGEAFRMIAEDSAENRYLKNHQDCCQYFQEKMKLGRHEEIILAAALSDSKYIRKTERFRTGSFEQVTLSLEEIVRFIVQADCPVLVLAHNHPDGTAKPSHQDIAETRRIAEYLKPLHIELFDHIIIGNGESYSMAEHHDF